MSWPTQGPSTRDVRASVAWYVANQLLTVPYAVYWTAIDKLQTGPTTWWHNYRAQQATHLLNPTLQTALQAAHGILTLLEPTPIVQWVVRPTVNGTLPPANYVPIPSIRIDVRPLTTGAAYELGSNQHWRGRAVDLAAVVRTPWEQDALTDALTRWFNVNTHLPIRNYASGDGTTVLADARVQLAQVVAEDAYDDEQVLAHQVGCMLDLELIA